MKLNPGPSFVNCHHEKRTICLCVVCRPFGRILDHLWFAERSRSTLDGMPDNGLDPTDTDDCVHALPDAMPHYCRQNWGRKLRIHYSTASNAAALGRAQPVFDPCAMKM